MRFSKPLLATLLDAARVAGASGAAGQPAVFIDVPLGRMDAQPVPEPEIVPGIGYVTWTSAGQRNNRIEQYLRDHRPEPRLSTGWPYVRSTRRCVHCGGEWVCSQAAWALSVSGAR